MIKHQVGKLFPGSRLLSETPTTSEGIPLAPLDILANRAPGPHLFLAGLRLYIVALQISVALLVTLAVAYNYLLEEIRRFYLLPLDKQTT